MSSYQHPSLGFSLELPPDAVVLDDVPGVALVAAEPFDAGVAFRANLVVTVEDLPAGFDDLEAYTDTSVANQVEALEDFRLIDREPATSDSEATRTLGHHYMSGQAVTLEQWRVLSRGRAYTLTASCWTLDYDALADAFTASAESFVP